MRKGFIQTHKQQETKKDVNDILTKYDLASQKVIINLIKKHFPNDSIIAEEDGYNKVSSDTAWVIDPIDGTNPYSRGIPTYGITIGYMKKFEAQFCIAYNPTTDEFVIAEKGKGCRKNGKKVRIAYREMKQNIALIEGFGTRLQAELRFKINPYLYQAMGRQSGCYSTIMTVSAQTDAYISKAEHIWDRIHYLILKEAGAKLTNLEGGKYTVDHTGYIAAHPKHHTKYLNIIREIYLNKRKRRN